MMVDAAKCLLCSTCGWTQDKQNPFFCEKLGGVLLSISYFISYFISWFSAAHSSTVVQTGNRVPAAKNAAANHICLY